MGTRVAIYAPPPSRLLGDALAPGDNYGAQVASEELTVQLLRRGAPGEYYVVARDEWVPRWRACVGGLAGQVAGLREVEVVSLSDLPREASGLRALVVPPNSHSTFSGLRAMWRMRESLTLVAPTHAISYPEIARWTAQMHLEWPSSSDVLTVATEAARRTLNSILLRSYARLRTAGAGTGPYPGSVAVAPYGVALDRFAGLDRERCRALLGLPRDAVVFLCLSRWSAVDKADPLPLLTAWRRVLESCECVLVIAGEDRVYSLLPRIEAAVSDLGLSRNVRLVASPDARLVPLLYGAADCFVSMVDSVQETFGLTLLEAMASGLPCVVSDWGPYREIVDDGETGLTVPTLAHLGDSDALVAAAVGHWSSVHFRLAQTAAWSHEHFVQCVCSLAADAALRERMGRAGRRKAERSYSWDAVVPVWERLLTGDAPAADVANDSGCQDVPGPVGPEPLDLIAYGEAFAHYPTGLLDASTILATTPQGEAVASGAGQLLMHQEAAALLREEVMPQVVRAAASPVTFEELRARLSSDGVAVDADALATLVAWLAKSGALRFGSSQHRN